MRQLLDMSYKILRTWRSRLVWFYLMRILQTFIAENTSYFSAASASGSKMSNLTHSRSGWRSGYMNWKRSSRVVECSGRETISLRAGNSGGANPLAWVRMFNVWTLKRTLSLDLKVISESAAETALDEPAIQQIIWAECYLQRGEDRSVCLGDMLAEKYATESNM